MQFVVWDMFKITSFGFQCWAEFILLLVKMFKQDLWSSRSNILQFYPINFIVLEAPL